MSLKDISIFSSSGHFFSTEQNGVYNFDRGHYEKHFCEIILYLGQWLSRCL